MEKELLMLLDDFINQNELWQQFKEWLREEGYSESFIEEVENYLSNLSL